MSRVLYDKWQIGPSVLNWQHEECGYYPAGKMGEAIAVDEVNSVGTACIARNRVS